MSNNHNRPIQLDMFDNMSDQSKLMEKIISEKAIERRLYWVKEIENLSGNFADDYGRLEEELRNEVKQNGIPALIDHLRLCGSIPEAYGHDSSEEKLYSKYTDCLLAMAFEAMGFKSAVLTERGDSADVEVIGEKCSFVADAKAFRLSRTAKNQKDFKVAALHAWKFGKKNAMVVCPIYQLPRSSSQIYHTAITYDVCVFTYSHLTLLLTYLELVGPAKTQELVCKILDAIPTINPSKSALDYWMALNKTMLTFSKEIVDLWSVEKIAATESVEIAKLEDLSFLAKQREAILKMTHEEALAELMKVYKIESKIKAIESVKDSGIFEIK